jgi:hypothetical protein
MEKNIIETMGTISKEEMLATVNFNVQPNTLVLESLTPFPGYHGENPSINVPKSLFLMCRKNYTREKILRATQKINKIFKYGFDAAVANIFLHNTLLPAIRIWNFPNYEDIFELQAHYKSEDIMFQKYKKIESKGIITIDKFFFIKDMGDGFYLDVEDRNMGYICIHEKISWKFFEKLTYNVRNNWEHKLFDAALGTIYRKGCIYDVIRVFSDQIHIETLKLIKEKYYTEFRKFE